MRVDHMRLINDPGYLARTAAKLSAVMAPGQVLELAFLHEADNACCRCEPYLETLRRLTGIAESRTAHVQLDVGAWSRQS